MKQKEGNNILMFILVIFIIFFQCSKKYDDINIATVSKEKNVNFISILNINCFPSKEIPLPYLSFTISNRAKCYDETSNNKYYLIYKGRSLELSHDSNDGYKMYLIRDLANFYSDIVSKKKNKSGEDFLFVNEKDLKRFFINFSRESYIVSENNCKIYFSRESKVKIQYNEIFWHYPR